MTEVLKNTLTYETINPLLQNGIFEGIPLIAEMLANASMSPTLKCITKGSRLTADLDAESELLRNRLLPEIAFIFLDATFNKVRLDGAVRDCAVLSAIGVRRSDGKRMALGVSAAISDGRTPLEGLYQLSQSCTESHVQRHPLVALPVSSLAERAGLCFTARVARFGGR